MTPVRGIVVKRLGHPARLLTPDEIRQISDSLDANSLPEFDPRDRGSIVLLGAARMLRDHVLLSGAKLAALETERSGLADSLQEVNGRVLRLDEALTWALRNDGGECPADYPAGYVKALRALGDVPE